MHTLGLVNCTIGPVAAPNPTFSKHRYRFVQTETTGLPYAYVVKQPFRLGDHTPRICGCKITIPPRHRYGEVGVSNSKLMFYAVPV